MSALNDHRITIVAMAPAERLLVVQMIGAALTTIRRHHKKRPGIEA